MKLLAFVDIHNDQKSLEKIKKKARQKDIDILVCAGDISTFSRQLDMLLAELNSIGKPVLIIPGNHEDNKALSAAAAQFEHIHDIHLGICEVGNILFMGYGGGGFGISDSRFDRVAKIFKKKMKGRKSVLVIHGPPHGTNLDKIGKEQVGNKSYTKFIKETKPALVLCGHLHENCGKKDTIGKTIIINPGWEGQIIEI